MRAAGVVFQFDNSRLVHAAATADSSASAIRSCSRQERYRHPYSVLLLDEIEKAHPDIFNILLSETSASVMVNAVELATDHKLRIWGAVIPSATSEAA